MSTADVCVGLQAGLRKLGHEVYEYTLDERIERSGHWLNHCWKKTGKAFPKPTSADIIYHAGEELVARSLRVMPDVVLIVSAMYIHPDVLVLLNRARLNVAILFTESPYDDEKQERLLRARDPMTGDRGLVGLAWTNERTTADPAKGIRYLQHAWHHEIHTQRTPDFIADASEVKAHDVVFVATGFMERIEILSAVDWTGIDFAIYGQWDLLPKKHPLQRHILGNYVSNAHAAEMYRRAKVGLNIHRTSIGFGEDAPRIAHAESLNPRAYELAATGCFTISDFRAEIPEVFGDLVPTFSRPEELRPLLDKWLHDDEGRARVRAALPAMVREHTWLARAQQIERDLLGAGIEPRSARSRIDTGQAPVPALLGG